MSNESDPPPSPQSAPTEAPGTDVAADSEVADRGRAATGREREIQLQNPCGYEEAGARRHRAWLESLIAELAPASTSLAVRFVSDREMRRLNSAYRSFDRSTDVLSFPDDPGAHLGDIAIAVPTARRQAAERGHGTARELRLLMLHGVLHCLGHDHESDDGAMERLEHRLRRSWLTDADSPKMVASKDQNEGT